MSVELVTDYLCQQSELVKLSRKLMSAEPVTDS